jgi:hypothetical protein
MQFVPSEKGLVGHIGSDDFIVIFTGDDWLPCCNTILKTFGNVVPSYYKDEDVKAGDICTENRAGHICFYPLKRNTNQGLYSIL